MGLGVLKTPIPKGSQLLFRPFATEVNFSSNKTVVVFGVCFLAFET